MLHEPLKILIADDNKNICDTLEDCLLIELEKYNIHQDLVEIKKLYTEHAYEHGCKCVEDGFRPDICIFDLVFNGNTGVDLYRYISNYLHGKEVYLCLYIGLEKKSEKNEKRKEAQVLASECDGLVTLINKPEVEEILEWFGDYIEGVHEIEKNVEDRDPFELL
jgi:CheY-like chemotaxis protein